MKGLWHQNYLVPRLKRITKRFTPGAAGFFFLAFRIFTRLSTVGRTTLPSPSAFLPRMPCHSRSAATRFLAPVAMAFRCRLRR